MAELTELYDTTPMSAEERGYKGFNAKIKSTTNDLAFCQIDQWGMDTKWTLVLDARFGRKICRRLKGFDELWAAVGVPTIVEGIDPDENVVGRGSLSHRESN